MSVHSKLMKARVSLQAKQLKKSGHNKFAGYEYFELGDFIPTVQEIFADVGLCGTITFYPDKAELTITDAEDNSSIVFSCPMATAMLKGCHEVQNLGASMTYIRRYLWVNALEIVEHDALDATTGNDGVKAGKGVIKPTDNNSFKPDGEEETFLLSVVDNILASRNDIAEATNLFYGQNLDQDQMTWIWNKLSSESALRRAIKEHNSKKEKQ